MSYNAELCKERHDEIMKRFDKGEMKMNSLSGMILGNGKMGLNERVSKIELIIARQESTFWRLISPLLPILYGVMGAAVILWLRQQS